MSSTNGRFAEDFPKKILFLVCNEIVHGLGIPAEIVMRDKAPTIETKFGNIIYFLSSNTFRIFLSKRGEQREARKTFKSVISLLTFIEEKSND